MGKVSIVGAGMRSHPGVAATVFTRARRRRHQHRDDLDVADQDLLRDRRRARARGGARAARRIRPRGRGHDRRRGPVRGRRDERRGRVSPSSARPARSGGSCSRCSRRAASPPSEIVPFASARSAGRELPGVGDVRRAARRRRSPASTSRCSPPAAATSREWAPRFAAAGAIVVDNSSAWRMDPRVPLVVSRGQPRSARRGSRPGIVANPNCTTMVIMLPLKALHDAFGLREMVATSFQAAGGAGQKGMDELAAQVPVLHEAREQLDQRAAPRRSPRSSIPSTPPRSPTTSCRGSARTAGDGYSDEEIKLVNESRKILELPDLRVSPTCVRVPVMVGHAIEVRATFAREVDLERGARRARGVPRARARPAADAGPVRRARRGRRRTHPPRPLRPALAQHVRRRRQPAQGRRAQRGADRRAAGRARAAGAARPRRRAA